MRSYDEEIDVRSGRVGQDEGPAQFIWRHRLWLIRRIQTRWLESAPWWESSAVRAARGEYATAEEADVTGTDLIAEQEIWRVEAANGRTGHEGVYELAHSWTTGQWRLLRVVD